MNSSEVGHEFVKCSGCGESFGNRLTSCPYCGTSVSQPPVKTQIDRGIQMAQEAERHLKDKNYEEAIDAFSIAISHDPKLKRAYRGRAETYRKLGKPRHADTDIMKLKSLGDFDADHLLSVEDGIRWKPIVIAGVVGLAISGALGFLVGLGSGRDNIEEILLPIAVVNLFSVFIAGAVAGALAQGAEIRHGLLGAIAVVGFSLPLNLAAGVPINPITFVIGLVFALWLGLLGGAIVRLGRRM